MKPKDCFTLAVALFGVWLLYQSVLYGLAYLQDVLAWGPKAIWMVYALVHLAMGSCCLFGAYRLEVLFFGRLAKSASFASHETRDREAA